MKISNKLKPNCGDQLWNSLLLGAVSAAFSGGVGGGKDGGKSTKKHQKKDFLIKMSPAYGLLEAAHPAIFGCLSLPPTGDKARTR